MPVDDPVFRAWVGKPNQAAATATATETARAYLDFFAVFGSDLPADSFFRSSLIKALEDIGELGILTAAHKRLATLA